MDDSAVISLGSLLDESRSILQAAGVANPALDARLLVERTTGIEAIDLVTRPELPIRAELAGKIRQMVARRAAGEPVFRVLGTREFYGLEFALSAGTLEPRPDTEILVELVLPLVRETVVREGECRLLDLGTGTGAIALAILSQVDGATAVGADISDDALATTAKNARMHGLEDRFETLHSDWYSNVTGRFHIIVANPPYIAHDVIETLEREVRDHDPLIALDGGRDGLDAYRAIAAGARQFLKPGGYVAIETGYDQKSAVTSVFADHGLRTTASAKDLGGNDRALLFAD